MWRWSVGIGNGERDEGKRIESSYLGGRPPSLCLLRTALVCGWLSGCSVSVPESAFQRHIVHPIEKAQDRSLVPPFGIGGKRVRYAVPSWVRTILKPGLIRLFNMDKMRQLWFCGLVEPFVVTSSFVCICQQLNKPPKQFESTLWRTSRGVCVVSFDPCHCSTPSRLVVGCSICYMSGKVRENPGGLFNNTTLQTTKLCIAELSNHSISFSYYVH